MLNPIVYYSAETYLFPELARRFAETGRLDPEEFYLILDWKAPRARTKHLRRLRKLDDSFESATAHIAADVAPVVEPKGRMKALLTTWRFYLPTASAILAVLYPEAFTIYDIRICDALGPRDAPGSFHKLGSGLGNGRWSDDKWQQYLQFIEAVRAEIALPAGLSLRDCDRWLWGSDKQKKMAEELNVATAEDAVDAHG